MFAGTQAGGATFLDLVADAIYSVADLQTAIKGLQHAGLIQLASDLGAQREALQLSREGQRNVEAARHLKNP
eukprot:15460263-Alexandrium_andersonii.AAC.1